MNIIMSRLHQYPNRLPAPIITPSSPLDFTDRIPFKEIQLSSETLGSGSFGTVFKGRWRGRTVAVKQFKTREEIDSFLIEVKQLSCVKHANIVTLYGASTLSETAYLIMEYAEGGSLNHLLHECKQQQYDLRHACSWAMQTARGVAYLHEIRPKPIMHRDLKPANLLLFSRGKILKICDFGTACTVKTQMTNNTGSASYMAPEVFATSSYLESGDVFSWSIIFWEILARRQPYSQQYSNPYQILWRVKQEGARPNELESCPSIIWNLITRSWHKDPHKRPTMREVANEMEFIFSLTERADRSTPTPTATTTTTTTHHQDNINVNNHLQRLQLSPAGLKFPISTRADTGHEPSSKLENFPFAPLDAASLAFQRSPSTNERRELYKQHELLLFQVESLRRRHLELTKSPTETCPDLVQEVSRLKEQIKMKKKELKLKQLTTGNSTHVHS